MGYVEELKHFINCIKEKHCIVIYPFLEVCNGGADAPKKINTTRGLAISLAPKKI